MCFRGVRVPSVRVMLVLIFTREKEYLCISSKLNVKVIIIIMSQLDKIICFKVRFKRTGNSLWKWRSGVRRVPASPLTSFNSDGEKVIPYTLPMDPAFNPVFLNFFIFQIPKNFSVKPITSEWYYYNAVALISSLILEYGHISQVLGMCDLRDIGVNYTFH